MTDWKTSQVRTNGITLHYQRTGSTTDGDKPPLVLCHGFSDCHVAWTRTAQALEDVFDLIMVDARGHGYSDKPERGYSSTDHAADIAGLIDALDLGQPALIGHSMGAATVAQLAADYPQLPRRIVLEDPPWRETTGMPTNRGAQMQELVAMYGRMSREEIAEYGRGNNPTWDDEELWLWSLGKTLVSPHVVRDTSRLLTDWHAVVPQITSPTLLVTADRARGGIVTPETAADLTEKHPNIQVAYIDGAGHNVRRDQFAAYIAAVRPFLLEP
ncbi:MAG: alpha/beta hydrolase [Caldilineaceae bacterium]